MDPLLGVNTEHVIKDVDLERVRLIVVIILRCHKFPNQHTRVAGAVDMLKHILDGSEEILLEVNEWPHTPQIRSLADRKYGVALRQ